MKTEFWLLASCHPCKDFSAEGNSLTAGDDSWQFLRAPSQGQLVSPALVVVPTEK